LILFLQLCSEFLNLSFSSIPNTLLAFMTFLSLRLSS
jgi:hypothetical protein